ncbi:DUF1501 domain-containing protein [Caldimonas brevitalea]|uniref:Tat pathway signal protein n=1 Tax=Caldimonas brevitalea TaxID=413882 RepID=A0A0G3BPT1_9BURK|nr:DUF1501 domain-containing protein [Caldimonas brevitalea]AKJ28575.1 hypothetical protein AAW51_1884 [Caldimonas brevitalea]
MTQSASRREFLKRAASFAALGAGAPVALNLAALGAASAQTAGDYKAIVCLFLLGGNDNANTLIPYDTAAYNAYAAGRTNLALPRAGLTPITAPALGGRQVALPASLAPLAPLYNERRCAFVANVGPLVAPTSLEDYRQQRTHVPVKLFSHNDQQSTWQSFAPEGAPSGWGGRIGDLLASRNSQRSFTAITLSGNTVFLTGTTVQGTRVNPEGALDVSQLHPQGPAGQLFGSSQALNAWRQMVATTERNNLLEREYGQVRRRAIAVNSQLGTALQGTALPGSVQFPGGELGRQLQMVARLIAARASLGAGRQVFYVSIGGFDHHSGLLGSHPDLLSGVAAGVVAFDRAMVAMGLSRNVTLFSASEFGRTLDSNGDGSDHGWGGHHFVVGGAVRGGDVYGQFPTVALRGPEDVGRGSLLPTTSVDQYAATFGRWLGVSDTDLRTVTPNLGNFSTPHLGFLT